MTGFSIHNRRVVAEAVTAAVLLALSFFLIAASDVTVGGTRLYWNLLVALFAAVALLGEWMYPAAGAGRSKSMAVSLAHWVGVIAAVDLIFLLVWSGRMDNADLGLSCGAVLALGAYTAGIRGRWMLLIVGVAVALATAAAAFIEQFVWALLGIGLLAVLCVVALSRFRAGRMAAHTA